MTEFATSETGARKQRKLARYDLIPTYPLRKLAEAYGKGLEKYPTEPGELDNWRRGYNWSDAYAALQRHANAAWGGEWIDEETGIPHLILAAFHAFSLVEWEQHPELVEMYDDRQDKAPEPEPWIDWFKPVTIEFAAQDINPELIRLFAGGVAYSEDDGPDFERNHEDTDEVDGLHETVIEEYADQIDAMSYALASVTALPTITQPAPDYTCKFGNVFGQDEPCLTCWPEAEVAFDEGPRAQKTGGW